MATIVIAEDDDLLSTLLLDVLADLGHDVRAAPHGRAAWNELKHRHPDLLITDYRMPEMTGLELAAVVRADPFFEAMPILLISGAQSDIGRAHPELFDIVEDKPIAIGQLLHDVDSLLRRGRTASPTPGPRT